MPKGKQRHHRTILAVLITVMVLGLCAVAIAQDSAEAQEQNLINIDVQDAAVEQVLQMLAKAANVNIVIGDGVSGRVEAVTLRDVTVESALRLIATAKGFHWYQDDNAYVVTAEEPEEGTRPTAGAAPTMSVDQDRPSRPGVGASPIQETGAGDEGVNGTPARSTGSATEAPAMESPGTGRVSASPADGEPEVAVGNIPVKYKDAATLALAFGGSVAGGNVAHERMGRSPSPSELRGSNRYTPQAFSGPDTMGGASSGSGWGQAIGGGGLGGMGGGDLGGTTGRQTTTGGIGGAGGGGLGGMLPGEMEAPIAYMPENALIVRGTQSEIDKFTEILEMLDKPTRQVEIFTKFVDIQTTAQEALGIDWSVSNGSLEFWNLGFQPAAAVQNVVRWGRGRFQAQLAALETTGRATVINEPHVTCHNNEVGEVSFVTTIPYYTSTNEYNQFGQRVRGDTEWEEVEVENGLYVMPRINGDDTVTMSLSPILSDQVGEVVGPDGSTYPIITEQEVYTSVTVQDGESIVMGGLIRKDENVTHQRTPLLADLPVIGKLFRSENYRTSNSELLIFVTPKIVREVPAQ